MIAGKIDQELLFRGIRIKENSLVAQIAAKKLRANSVAIVIGKTIHLHNVSRKYFLGNEKWVKHEICHVKQFQQYGFILFIIRYLWESLRKGYVNNKYEVAAREAENL